jgi:hypothetical protein
MRGDDARENFKRAVGGVNADTHIFKRQVAPHIVLANQKEMIVFLAKLTGPGHVWLQSLPFSRLASRIFAAAPQTGGRSREEGGLLTSMSAGGLLGSVGSLLGGDND